MLPFCSANWQTAREAAGNAATITSHPQECLEECAFLPSESLPGGNNKQGHGGDILLTFWHTYSRPFDQTSSALEHTYYFKRTSNIEPDLVMYATLWGEGGRLDGSQSNLYAVRWTRPWVARWVKGSMGEMECMGSFNSLRYRPELHVVFETWS